MKTFFLIIGFLFINLLGFSQDRTDSLFNLLKKTSEDTTKVNILIDISEEFKYSNPDTAEYFLMQSLDLAKKTDFSSGEALSCFNLGQVYEIKGLYSKSARLLEASLIVFTKLNDERQIGEVKNALGRMYEKKGDYEKALNYYLQSLRIREKLKDNRGIASCFNSIGNIYLVQDDTINAKISFHKAYDLIVKVNNKIGIATVLNNLGVLYDRMLKYDSALVYYFQSLKIHEELNNMLAISQANSNIGNMYYIKGDYPKALHHYNKSIEIAEQIGDLNGKVNVFINIGVLYQKQNKFNEAIIQVKKGLEIAKENQFYEGLRNCYDVLSELYSATNNWQEAYNAVFNFALYRDTLINETNSKTLLLLREEFDAEKRDQEIALQNAVISENNATIQQQRTRLLAFTIGVVLLLVLGGVVYNGYRQKKKANVLLAYQNAEIMSQKAVIEDKNRDIMASITYAKRIQEAILPPEKLVQKNLEKSFVLYKPKDIVSGDFYWMDHKENIILYSVVDCTGHGVPGAFMSIVGHNGLNQAVNEYGLVHPGEIMDKLNDLVEKTLHKDEGQSIKDGMDMALCAYDINTNIIEFAGANNPIYIIKKKGDTLTVANSLVEPVLENDNYSLFEIKANRQPIGAHVSREKFTNHTFQLNPGDSVYIFSDGFPDQFGGKNGKKFKYKPFKELLLSIQDTNMTEQRFILDKTIEDWKGSHEQVDDICVIGVRI